MYTSQNYPVSINIPDFRSSERTFQLVTQAAGRSGRGDEKGKVIIQTYSPESAAVVYASKHDYRSFYEREIGIRNAAAYPPFSDIFQIIIQNADKVQAEKSAQRCAQWLKKALPEDAYVLGPAANALVKTNGMFRYQILIKAGSGLRKEVTYKVFEMKKLHEESKDTSLLTTDINPFSYI